MQKFMCYCTGFALFYFEFEGNFRVQSPAGGLYLEAEANYRSVFVLRFWGAYIWRGSYMEGLKFYGIHNSCKLI